MQPKTIQNTFFLILLVGTTLAFVGLLQDFFQPLFWASVLAIIFHPVHQRLREKMGDRDSWSALLTVLLIVLLVIVPLFLIGIAVTKEAAELYERVASGEIDLQEPVRAVERMLPIVTDYLNRFGVESTKIQQGLSTAAVAVSQFLAAQAVVIGQNALRFSILFFVMLYLLFFFLRDGEKLTATIIRALPMGEGREAHLLARFAKVSRATIKGTLVVGLIQGILGGLLFWVVGIEAAIFWGVIMTLLSLFPAIGSVLVWGPAAIILLFTGELIRGIIVLVVGTLIIGLVDNMLRPILVGHETKMPDYLVLISTLGGLTVFGISGFVIGPIIAALFLSVWAMFGQIHSEPSDVSAVK